MQNLEEALCIHAQKRDEVHQTELWDVMFCSSEVAVVKMLVFVEQSNKVLSQGHGVVIWEKLVKYR